MGQYLQSFKIKVERRMIGFITVLIAWSLLMICLGLKIILTKHLTPHLRGCYTKYINKRRKK